MKRTISAGAVALGPAIAGVTAPAASATGTSPSSTTLGTGAAYRAALHAGPDDAFRSRGILRDRDGSSHVRYDRSYRVARAWR